MYDLERIGVIIKDIEKYLAEQKAIGLNEENVHNSEKFYASSMILFSIINRMIDLTTEIIVKNDFGMPSAYELYFDVLAKKGIIEAKMVADLKQLAKDRNLFAHQYFDMEEKKVLSISKKIYVVRDFVERIKKVVEKSRKADKEQN